MSGNETEYWQAETDKEDADDRASRSGTGQLGKQISHLQNIWYFYHVAYCGEDTMAYCVIY